MLELEVLGQARHVLAIGAHPDDIEIGCGGTLLTLAGTQSDLCADVVVMTGDDRRHDEARRATELFLPGASVERQLFHLPDGRLPTKWGEVKDLFEQIARTRPSPDVIFCPSRDDAHQDHRMIAELVPTVWRDHFILEYELPKWDGDLSRPAVYSPLTLATMQEKVLRLQKAFPSQASRDWWSDETFFGLARLRGMECRTRYAEAFAARKTVVTWQPRLV